ncbi:MAG: MFS transporter [Bryobacteraceae bacterium]
MKTFLHRWGLCLMMMAATTLIYLDRQALSLLAPVIQEELGIDNRGLGWVFSAFYYAYTGAQFAVGLLLDRLSLRWMYGGAVLAWAAASTLTGAARSFGMLVAFRIVLAIVESGNWPGAMRIVARALPPQDRALGNGIFTSGTSVGALIAPAMVIGVSSAVGWRWSFVALGLAGAVWFAAWVWFTRGPALGSVWRTQPGESRGAGGIAAYAALVRLPQFWRVFAITILVNPILYFFLNWLPVYYKQQHGIGQGARLAKILTATFLGLDLGYLACGATILLLTRRGWTLRTARRAVLLTASVLLAGIAAAPAAGSLNATVAIIVAAVFATGVWISMYLTLAQEVSPASVSTAAGLLGGSGAFAGALLMGAVGVVTQATGSFALPFYAVAAMGVLAGAAGWMASRVDPA